MMAADSLFDLKSFRSCGLARALAVSMKMLEGTGIMQWALDPDSEHRHVISRFDVAVIGDRIDKEMAGNPTFARSVFEYRVKGRDGSGPSYAQSVGMIRKMITPVLGITVSTENRKRASGGELVLSKASMINFCERYKPMWWGNEKFDAFLPFDDNFPFLNASSLAEGEAVCVE
eukprot:jgi/Mesvir1/11278/Mv01074-RA.1